MINTNQFLAQMQEVLEIEDRTLSPDEKFRELSEWSSLAYLSTIAMIDDEYNVIISAADFRELQTFGDIARAIEKRKA